MCSRLLSMSALWVCWLCWLAADAAAGAATAADAKQLAAFWDGLGEAQRRAVMDCKAEHNGEHLYRQVGWAPDPPLLPLFCRCCWPLLPAFAASLLGAVPPSLHACVRGLTPPAASSLSHHILPPTSTATHPHTRTHATRRTQVEIQLLHRQRDGALDLLTLEQRRLHAAGRLLHEAVGGYGPRGGGEGGGGAAGSGLHGSHLIR